MARAPALQAGGRGFDSHHLHRNIQGSTALRRAPSGLRSPLFRHGSVTVLGSCGHREVVQAVRQLDRARLRRMLGLPQFTVLRAKFGIAEMQSTRVAKAGPSTRPGSHSVRPASTMPTSRGPILRRERSSRPWRGRRASCRATVNDEPYDERLVAVPGHATSRGVWARRDLDRGVWGDRVVPVGMPVVACDG